MGFKNKKVESAINNLFSARRKSSAAEALPSETGSPGPANGEPAPATAAVPVEPLPTAPAPAEQAGGAPPAPPVGLQQPEPATEVRPAATAPEEQAAEVPLVLPAEVQQPEPVVEMRPAIPIPEKQAAKAPLNPPARPKPPEAVTEVRPAAPAAAQPGAASSKPAVKEAPAPVQHGLGTSGKSVIFTLAGVFYGVSIDIVESIIKLQQITVVPHAHPYVRGVTNLRGSVLPVIDLRRRLGLPEAQDDKNSRIIVVAVKGEKIGMVVDTVSEVQVIAAADIEPLPALAAAAGTEYVLGVAKAGERLITLLDVAQVLGL